MILESNMKLKIKDAVKGTKVKLWNSNYGSMQVLRVVPKKESKTTYTVVEVEMSSSMDYNFTFALKKWYPLGDLVKVSE